MPWLGDQSSSEEQFQSLHISFSSDSTCCFLSPALWYPNWWKKGGHTSTTSASLRLAAVSLKTRKESPHPHNSSFSSSAQMQAARWLFIKGRQPKVHTVLNTVSARESQATSTLETKPRLRFRSEQMECRHHRNFASQRYLLAPQVS